MMELGAGRILFTCWLPTSPVTCQRVTESIFCTVTVRGHWRETVLKKGFFEKCGDGRPSFFARNSGSGDLLHEMRDWKGTASSLWWVCMATKKTLFPDISMFLVPFFSRTEYSSSWIQPATMYSHCLERKVTKTVFVLSFKEAHYQLVDFQLAFSETCCFRWFSFSPWYG